MTKVASWLRTFLPFAICGLAVSQVRVSGLSLPTAMSYGVSETLHVGGPGGWDYLTVDPDHKLLFVPRSTHTMVLDAANGNVVADITGQKRNHGVALAPNAQRGFISDGEDASVVIFDLKTYAVLGKVKVEPDADGIIFDASCNRVLLVCGDAGVLIPIPADTDATTARADAAVDLGGKPEFLVADGHGRVFINLVDKNQVAVVDTKTMKVLAHWSTSPGGSPVGMSMDREHRRLFIGCRNPRTLVVMNADDGQVLADLPIGAGNQADPIRTNAGAEEHDRLCSANGLRMNGRDPFVTDEILHVKRENAIEPMHFHGGHQGGIVHLRTNEVVLNHEPPPLTKGFHRIGQDQEHSFEPAGITVSRGYAEPEAVYNRGSCAHIPELSHVLGGDAQNMLFSRSEEHTSELQSLRHLVC